MSFLFAQPEMLGAAATDLASIGSAISTANAAAAAATTRVLAAGADEVSAAVAALFSGHAQTYQALSTQAAAFHQQIVQTLTSTAGAYASAEAANVEQQLLGAINAPTMALLGRPLIGHGADGAPGTGQAGGAGGILYGNGGPSQLQNGDRGREALGHAYYSSDLLSLHRAARSNRIFPRAGESLRDRGGRDICGCVTGQTP